MQEQNEICSESCWEHPVISNGARLVGQTSLSAVSVSTNKTSTSSVATEDTWAKDVWDLGRVIFFCLYLITLHKLVKGITLFSGF